MAFSFFLFDHENGHKGKGGLLLILFVFFLRAVFFTLLPPRLTSFTVIDMTRA